MQWETSPNARRGLSLLLLVFNAKYEMRSCCVSVGRGTVLVFGREDRNVATLLGWRTLPAVVESCPLHLQP